MEFSRTHFEVLGFGYKSQVLGLEASSPRPRTAPFFESLKFCWKTPKTLRKICETFFFLRSPENILKTFFLEKAYALCSWSLALASRESVLEKSVLGLGLDPFVLDSTSGVKRKQITAHYETYIKYNLLIIQSLNFLFIFLFLTSWTSKKQNLQNKV